MNQIIMHSLSSAGTYLLIALSFWIIYSTLKFFHLAHGVVYTVGAYTGYSFIHLFLKSDPERDTATASIWLYIGAVVAAVILAVCVGVLIELFVYRPLRRKKASNLILLLASFGVFIFIQNLIALAYENQILTIRTGPVKEGIRFLGAVITPVEVLIVVSALLVFTLLFFIIRYTRLGTAMRAVSDDPVSAKITGIDTDRVILLAFIIGSALVGFSGVLISLEKNLEPTMGFNILLKGVIVVIIGGIGSLYGVLVGSLFLGFVENLAVWYIPGGWKDAIAFGIFLLFLIFRPQGILGKKED